MKIVGLTPQERALMAASFLVEQMRKNNGGQFTINIGHDDPASAVKNFSSKNILNAIAKLTYEKEGKSKTLEQNDMQKILQQILKAGKNIVGGIAQQQNSENDTARKRPIRGMPDPHSLKPRPPGSEY